MADDHESREDETPEEEEIDTSVCMVSELPIVVPVKH